MKQKSIERKEAWKTIFIFLIIVTVVSTPFYLAIVNLYPSRIYVGALMWCPAIAAIITLKIKGRPISLIHWNWADWKYIRWSYFTPAIYVFITYILIWFFGLGELSNVESIMEWAKELGYIGIQIPTLDKSIIDLDIASESQTYCDEFKGKIYSFGLEIKELSTHIQGQLVAVQ